MNPVVHAHFTVNGKKVDIPSYLLKAGDVIGVREKFRGSDKMKAITETCGSRPVPMWLDMNRDTLEAKVVHLPNREDIESDIQELLIVEYYSR